MTSRGDCSAAARTCEVTDDARHERAVPRVDLVYDLARGDEDGAAGLHVYVGRGGESALVCGPAVGVGRQQDNGRYANCT